MFTKQLGFELAGYIGLMKNSTSRQNGRCGDKNTLVGVFTASLYLIDFVYYASFFIDPIAELDTVIKRL